MEKHWAMITWNGTHAMASQEFTHIVWSAKGHEAVQDAAHEWGRKNLAPSTVERMTVQYLGWEERTA